MPHTIHLNRLSSNILISRLDRDLSMLFCKMSSQIQTPHCSLSLNQLVTTSHNSFHFDLPSSLLVLSCTVFVAAPICLQKNTPNNGHFIHPCMIVLDTEPDATNTQTLHAQTCIHRLSNNSWSKSLNNILSLSIPSIISCVPWYPVSFNSLHRTLHPLIPCLIRYLASLNTLPPSISYLHMYPAFLNTLPFSLFFFLRLIYIFLTNFNSYSK